MIKVVTAIKRKPGMDLETFTHHWRTTHAAIVTQVPAIRRYVQSQTIPSGYRKGEPAFDGIAELWYDDTAGLHRALASPHSEAAMKDNGNFLDMNNFLSVLTDEVVQKDGASNPSMVKLVEFILRKPGLEPREFQQYWKGSHGPLVLKIPQLRRYVQSHVHLSSYREGRKPPFDGVVEVWFDDTDAMRESSKTAEYAAVRADEPNFLDSNRLNFIITRERVII